MIHKTLEIGHEKESVTRKICKNEIKVENYKLLFINLMKSNNNLLHGRRSVLDFELNISFDK